MTESMHRLERAVAAAAPVWGRMPGRPPGRLRDSVTTRGPEDAVGGLTGWVTAGDAAAFYAMWVEEGTGPHEEVIRNRADLLREGEVEIVHHPGATPTHFMRDTADRETPLLLQTWIDETVRAFD